MSTAAALKSTAAAARSKLRLSESEMRRSASAFVSAGVIGVMSRAPEGGGAPPLSKLAFWGIPGTAVLAVVAKGGASFATGDSADYLNGLGDAAAIVSIASFTSGRDIAGLSGVDDSQELSGRRRRGSSGRTAEQLEAEIRRRLEAEEELAAIAEMEGIASHG